MLKRCVVRWMRTYMMNPSEILTFAEDGRIWDSVRRLETPAGTTLAKTI